MLHVVVDPLYEHLLAAFPPTHGYGTAAFEREPMPPLVAHYLGHRLRRRLEVEAASYGTGAAD